MQCNTLQISAKVQQAAMAVGLDGDGFYTLAGQLSGGMRRRLSIAMSLVGDPPIIFMDGKQADSNQEVG
jgi:ABC-type multidrug transport system ATPase subunit